MENSNNELAQIEDKVLLFKKLIGSFVSVCFDGNATMSGRVQEVNESSRRVTLCFSCGSEKGELKTIHVFYLDSDFVVSYELGSNDLTV